MATGLDNLWIYKLAEDLEIKIHEVLKKFPVDEKYRSIDQIKRSSAYIRFLMAKDETGSKK